MRLTFFIILVKSVFSASCFVCETQLDHIGNLLPGSDEGCFDEIENFSNYSRECNGVDHVCAIDLRVEWPLYGDQVTTLTRKCTGGPLPENKCTGNYDIELGCHGPESNKNEILNVGKI